jgi:predicted TIM-barrel fold metal-dependent hydrolase
MEKLACRVILMVGPSSKNWGLKLSRAIFEASNDVFGGQKFLHLSRYPLNSFYTSRPFQLCKKCVNQSSYAIIMPPTS